MRGYGKTLNPEPEEEEEKTYKIRRFHFRDSEPTVTLKRGLTLEEAQEHCSDPETSSSTCTRSDAVMYFEEHGPFFDGYDEE